MQLVNQSAQNHGAGGTQRVTHGDGAAIDVDLLVRHFHLFHEAHHHGGKGFVDFKQINLPDRHAGLGQGLARGRHGAGQHDGRVGTAQGRRHNARTRRKAMGFASRLRANQHRRSAIHNARRVARMVHVVDARNLGIPRLRHLIKAHGPHLFKRRFERGQALHRGVRLDELVFRQNDLVRPILHRHHRALEIAVGAGSCGTLLRFQRKGIDVLA